MECKPLKHFAKSRFLKTKRTIVFDIDETLVKTTLMVPGDELDAELNEFKLCITKGSLIEVPFKTKFRPGVVQMMQTLSEHFEIILFSAGVKDYCSQVAHIIEHMVKAPVFSHILSRHYCLAIDSEPNLLMKDLGVFLHNRLISDIILVDNKPQGCIRHLENYIPVRDFENKELDTEL